MVSNEQRRKWGAARLRSFGSASDDGRSGGLVSGARGRGELGSFFLWFFLFAAASVFVSHGNDIGIKLSGMKVCGGKDGVQELKRTKVKEFKG